MVLMQTWAVRVLVLGGRVSGYDDMGNVRKAHPIHALLGLGIPSHKPPVAGQTLLVAGYPGYCHSRRPASAVSVSEEVVEGACPVAEAGGAART